MKKEHIQIAVIAVGLLVLAVIVFNSIKKPANKAARPDNAAAAVPAQESAPVAAVLPDDRLLALQEKRWLMNWGRDPFLIQSDNMGRLDEFQLKGISFAKGKKGYAFINDKIVRQGDVLGEYEISDIAKDKVQLKRGSQYFYLSFPETE